MATPELGIYNGRFQVVGKTIRLTSDPSKEMPAGKTWIVEIESITERELEIVGGIPAYRERMFWKRSGGY